MNTQLAKESRHPIRVVSKRTGLTPTLLRAWERRYGVVAPARSDGGQRLYSDEDVRRLALLNQVVGEGRNISQVASLSMEELEDLVREDRSGRLAPPPPEPLGGASIIRLMAQAEDAVVSMDAPQLERVLIRGAMAFPAQVVTDQLIVPLLGKIGEDWRSGRLGPAQEHLASRVVRRVLEWLLDNIAVEEDAPVLLSATPAGETHEFGALLSAVTAASEGWRGVFLGPDLPAVEIAGAALRLQARAVALSILGTSEAESWLAEVEDLRRRLPTSVMLFLGRPSEMRPAWTSWPEGIREMGNFEDLRIELRSKGGRG